MAAVKMERNAIYLSAYVDQWFQSISAERVPPPGRERLECRTKLES